MSDDFDPFADEPRSRPSRRENEQEQTPHSFDPWADLPTRASLRRHGLELPTDAPGLGGMWHDDDAWLTLDLGAGQGSEPSPAPGGRILVVCTGNVCRSPYIHLRLAAELDGLGIEVTSAGTGALAGWPVDPGSVALLDAAGIDSTAFRARQLTVDMVEDADLVLTATRAHRRAVVQEAPLGLRKTFALTDFADLVVDVQPQEVEAARGRSGVGKLVAAAGARRHLVHARPEDDDADIVDPFKMGPEVFAQMEREITPSLDAVVDRLRAVSQPI
ncbi:arsenate reductase/protein-tyrosine-phosphatase family protein [Dermacoccus barathri]|uniref:arsenate reductase/protein-tyrosine-phosphatase family protein n=1 Tax=Dermacoccus barathri TaxID=322601 RepID=UPI00187905C7|nr:hypothetical protein [Dermacoccus barathri]MBE7370807.1 hypothetical protein [Dermacoccus barathri]